MRENVFPYHGWYNYFRSSLLKILLLQLDDLEIAPKIISLQYHKTNSSRFSWDFLKNALKITDLEGLFIIIYIISYQIC